MRLSGERGLYVTSGLLREGGQALVYRARDRRGRAVAVKLAREPGLLADELAGLSRFRDRPWLVPLLDHGRHQGAEFLVLPLFECDLGAWLKAHLGMERLVALEQAALAVCELHRADPDPGMTLVHRDIKPSNFLVRGEPPEVVLADLGAFKRRDVLDSDPHTLICTPQYAPLDQQLGLHGPLQASWDVHALGVAIYWGIAGRFPEAVQARAAALRPEGERLLALRVHLGIMSRPEAGTVSPCGVWPSGLLAECRTLWGRL